MSQGVQLVHKKYDILVMNITRVCLGAKITRAYCMLKIQQSRHRSLFIPKGKISIKPTKRKENVIATNSGFRKWLYKGKVLTPLTCFILNKVHLVSFTNGC